MKAEALINNQMIRISQQEKEAAETFHRKRRAFAWIGNEFKLLELGDDRDHQHWLKDDYNIYIEEFENINGGGYMVHNKIQLFKGSDFKQADIAEIYTIDYKLSSLIDEYYKIYGPGELNIYNGVHTGKIGEIWEPIERVVTYAFQGLMLIGEIADEERELA